MARYVTVGGEVLDRICYDFYGVESKLVEVLEANPGLAEITQPFAAGIAIELPNEVANTQLATEAVRLWE